MSRVASCPRCARQVSLPASDDPSAWVRCPLCGNQYPLQAALDYVPPKLEIVQPPALGAAEGSAQSLGLLSPEHSLQPAIASQDTPMPETTVPGGMVAAVVQPDSSATAAEPSADMFASAIALEVDRHAPVNDSANEQHDSSETASAGGLPLADDDDVPFIAESDGHALAEHPADEHVIAEQELSDAENPENAFLPSGTDEGDHFGEDEFHFADEESAAHEGDAGGFTAIHDSPHEPAADASHALGAIATMAATPPKKKRQVPLAVRLIGIGIFFGIGAVGCYIVAAAFLYFGIADVPEFSRGWFPDVLVAKSLKQQRTPGRNGTKPQPPSQTTTTGQNTNGPDAKPNDSTVADATPDSKNAEPASDKANDRSNDKTVPSDKAAPSSADSDKSSTKPNVADAIAPGKADPATNPFDNPKPADSDAAKDDSTKVNPLADTSKAPSLDLPDVKGAGKKLDAATNPPADKVGGDKSPTGKPDQSPAAASSEKPSETIAPKSDVSFSLGDVADAVTAVERTSADLAEAAKENDDAKLKAARIANFRTMSHLASVVTFAKPADAKESGQLAAIKSQIAKSLASSAAASASEREVVGGYARVGVNSKSRKESGLFMAGVLNKIEPHGKLFESQLELPGGMAPLLLLTPQKPPAAEGSGVLLLGAVVNDPAKNLPGYDGTAEMVIFSDVVVAAPK